MTKRMLIDSTHAEETRVVVLEGNRLEDFDVETSTKQQLKGNIYLAKVVRVEPSLQAAFVEYGGGRHGFLAFGEIHPDYYQIPVADRQRLLEMQEAEAREDEDAEERAAARDADLAARPTAPDVIQVSGVIDIPDMVAPANARDAAVQASYAAQADPEAAEDALPRGDQVTQAAAVSQDILVAPHEAETLFPDDAPLPEIILPELPEEIGADMAPETASVEADADPAPVLEPLANGEAASDAAEPAASHSNGAASDQPFDAAEPPPESVGGETEESREQRAPPRFLRNYKIQEVVRRRQILLVQVVKEERGTKGAALTTYISLAGRFSVLMPNSPRGGGISRKITSAADRRRLKEVTAELDLPRGMGLIVRTAGANRPKPEITRDCEYLLNQWDQIRDLTMKSVAPALIYEEANLIKRAIRDVYSRDVDDILVDGEQGWRAARDFMRMLMPTHARKVQLWRDPQPLFVKAQVEAQLDAMLSPTVQLRSGGYLVINQTEALVAIDVNSGRSTRERGIEETALKTNMEAAEEAARQLRLRDLAGLIVIDFIDMESRRNISSVEKRLKDALKNDRARIQVGSISHFGLMEMSRQRLRPSLAETSLVMCPHCAGTGQVRSTESAALHVLRGIEEEGAKRRAAEVTVHVAGPIALYVLNHKRVRLAEIEARYGMHVAFAADDTLLPPTMRIERLRAQTASELPAPISQLAPPEPFEDPDEEVAERGAEAAAGDDGDDDDAPRPGETAEEGEQRSRRRRRRRRGGRREDGADDAAAVSAGAVTETQGAMTETQGEPNGSTAPDATGDFPAERFATHAPETVPDTGIAAAEMAAAPALGVAEPSASEAVEVPASEAADATASGAATPTAPEAAEATGDDVEHSKRRGRRGGRRRRRDPDDAQAAPLAAEPAQADSGAAERVTPAYAGPTPANPFGGGTAFDIFDAIEQAEQERAIAATAAAQRPPEPAASLPAAEDSSAEPEPVIAEPIAMAPETVSLGEPDPAIDSAASEPEPEPDALPDKTPIAASPAFEPVAATDAELAPEPVGGPLITPTLIDGNASPAEMRRGWWRR
jgi:ribonuclease E